MSLSLARITDNDLPSMHAILMLCGEHMHRVQGMSHWYPGRPYELYRKSIETASVYAIYDDALLIGTFYVTETMRPWYSSVVWANNSHRALYLGGFGVLPLAQGRGAGKWAMSQVDALAIAGDYNALRFDGVADNPPLLKFYDDMGYIRRGSLNTPYGSQVMTYERLFVDPK